jgi:tricorn protease
MRVRVLLTALFLCASPLAPAAPAAPPVGYYRQPALAGDSIVFVSEGDLWKVPVKGGVATRLTTHVGEEGMPAVSPDGQTLAFLAQYEGPTEVYTLPLAGGTPRRRTFGAGGVTFIGWTPDGQLLYSTTHHSTLPSTQLVRLDVSGKNGVTPRLVPLAQAADGCFDAPGKTLYFTRLPFQGSHTKRYRGGTAQNLWKFTEGEGEARPLTADYKGTSKSPLWWQGRVYFVSDRDGTMNLWSMAPDGGDLRQHTRHKGWDVAAPSLRDGRIVYQLGADLHLYDIAADKDRRVPITLGSDFDQTRERWVAKPMEYLTAAHLAPDGSRVVLTARGRVFVAPHRQGRFVEATRQEGVRYRDARFLPGGKKLLALSDQSGEVELWTLPANGVGKAEQLTQSGEVLRWEAVPSPDGKLIAHRDKNQRLFVFDMAQKKDRLVEESKIGDLEGLRWSPDGKWLAYVSPAENEFEQIKLYGVADGKVTALTSDRFDSYSPAWSPDGKWLYLLSDRNLKSVVKSPWGNYQPEPFLDKKTRVYQIALTEELRSPFTPADELHPEKKDKKEPKKKDEEKKPAPPPAVKIELAGIQARLQEVPLPPGNYRSLSVTDKALFWLSTPSGEEKSALQAAAITNDNIEVKTVAPEVKSYELSQDGKKLLLHKGDNKGDKLYIVDAAAAPADLAKKEVTLDGWALSVQPREEWRQMFVEAWRLERDYFYDRGLHGVDWKAMLKKYLPLVERVNSRSELSDLLGQMVSELSALHIFVAGGDYRKGSDKVDPASLGAVLARDEAGGGYRVAHIYRSDPDEPERLSPLSRPGVGVKEGDLIEAVNGTATLSVPDIGHLLRRQAGRQVLLRVKAVGDKARDVIVKPLSQKDDGDLRYHEWEYTRRLLTDELGKGELGYVHLRAMGGANFTEWAKGFYPVFHRKGLIIDVRNNRGGNIDSWILNRLLRKAWFHWNQRVGQAPRWNMQYAFRGHIVVLCNEFTASDGEAFAEGVKRLGLGKVIGTRTWGGEIWLSFSNTLVDKGIASSAEYGVYGPEGSWLIEGHGVDPDIVVDNLPHATFKGEDAQLRAAVAHLQRLLRERPVTVPPPPPFPRPAAVEGAPKRGRP